jgi:hypothetical protein
MRSLTLQARLRPVRVPPRVPEGPAPARVGEREAPDDAGATSAVPLPDVPNPPAPPPEAEGHEGPPPVYRGSSRLLDWKNTARGGMTVDLSIRDAGPFGVHPFKGLVCGKESGQRLRVWATTPLALTEDGKDAAPVYSGEAILLRWSDDSLTGLSVKLLLDNGPDGTDGKHPFDGMVTGRKEGDALEMGVWAINDDETVQHPGQTRRRTPFHELNEVKQSQILCRDARFVSFLAARENVLCPEPVTPRPETDASGYAASVLYSHLGISSRSELNHETVDGELARRRWREVISEYFREQAGMR